MLQAPANMPVWKCDRQTRAPDRVSVRVHTRRDNTMTLSKILATTAVVGMIGSAALANDINFSQSGGSINNVTFTQTGAADLISSNGTTAAAPATVTGSLDSLKMEQIGSSNKGSFAITAGAGNVAVLTYGDLNTTKLAVTQASGGSLSYTIGILGANNSVDSTITSKEATVNIESQGDHVAYTIGQTGTTGNTNVNSIIANVSKSGPGDATVALTQSGASDTILMGAPSAYGAFSGTGGLTLNGAATVAITQSADYASYTATQTVPAGGSLTVSQSN